MARYALRKPCSNCPFRTDVAPYLRRERAIEIAGSIARGAEFPCHKTTVDDPDDDTERIATERSQFCAGALIVMEKQQAPNQIMRVAERTGFYDAERLDMSAPVVGSLVEFVNHHGGEEEPEVCSQSDYGCEAPAGYMVDGVAVLAEEGGEVHECPTCGEPVCESCSNDKGVCSNCADDEEADD